jgi:hypothetical protein
VDVLFLLLGCFLLLLFRGCSACDSCFVTLLLSWLPLVLGRFPACLTTSSRKDQGPND